MTKHYKVDRIDNNARRSAKKKRAKGRGAPAKTGMQKRGAPAGRRAEKCTFCNVSSF